MSRNCPLQLWTRLVKLKQRSNKTRLEVHFSMLDPICGPFFQKLVESKRNDQKVSEIPESTRNEQKISEITNTLNYYKVPKYQKVPTGSRYYWKLPKITKKCQKFQESPRFCRKLPESTKGCQTPPLPP